MNNTTNSVPIWNKYLLTVNEASAYFGIGTKKIRKIVDNNIESGLIIQNGSKHLINRKKFEDFLNKTTSI